ncbi:MAG: sulfotransferase [Candidatus Nanopelagicales bacterium]|nr:sulfotransferase [Candidatus Nanopelagicales bacterium]
MNPPIPNPVFTGGTGRSGTTIVGRLLGQHPEIALTRPAELRFITDSDGLLDAIASQRHHPPLILARAGAAASRRMARIRRTEPRDPTAPADLFAALFERRWFPRIAEANPNLTPTIGTRAARDFAAAFRSDRQRAARRLMQTIVDPMARTEGRRRWVDTTPPNASRADEILDLYPQARIINVIRDGRRVAYSMTRRTWAPDRVIDALDVWQTSMLAAAQAIDRAPTNTVMTVQLEDLVVRARLDTYRRILSFAELEDDPATRQWFEENVALERSRPDLWERCLSPAEIRQLNEHYDQVIDELTAAGVRVPT